METGPDYRLLFEEGAEGMLVLTAGGDVLDANRKACGMLWRASGQLKAAGREGVFDPGDPRLQLAFEELRAIGRFDGELGLLRLGEEPFPADVSMARFGDGLVSVVLRDAAKRRRAEDEARLLSEDLEEQVAERAAQLKAAVSELRKSEERYQSFVEHSTEGIWCFELEEPISTGRPESEQVDHFYRHCYLGECNDAMAKMYGYERSKEFLGTRLGDLLPRSEPGNVEYLVAFVRSGYRLTGAESREADRNGRTRFFSNNLTGVVEGDLLVRAWGTQRDITGRKRAEEQRRSLTPQEVEVLGLMAQGYTNRRISQDMRFSEGTVKYHMRHIFDKLGVSSRSRAAVRAAEIGLVEPE